MAEVTLSQDAFTRNNRAAAENRQLFEQYGVLVINLMSSPGAGKTSLLQKTIEALGDRYRIGVIQGDLATQIDADRVRARGAQAVQINTHGVCHLEAHMVNKVLPQLDLDELDLLFIENVGNLICPSGYDLGEHHRITVLSVPEGNDKILKYPVMFLRTELVLLNKIDVLPYFDFDVARAVEDLRAINPRSRLIPVSAKEGTNLDEWYRWIDEVYARRSRAAG
ncbi:MAG TPA: hydrogenase nickel incorporation protein HypB [Thermaerobacter sp.]